MTWQVRIKGPRHLAASGLGRSDGTVDPGPLRDAIHPPVDGDRQEVLKVGEVRDGEESYLDGEELGELYLLLLLDDAGPSPVDVDRQEVLEDGEVYDQDESYQDDEDLEGFATSFLLFDGPSAGSFHLLGVIFSRLLDVIELPPTFAHLRRAK